MLDVAGLPNIALTVPGRKSGIPRTTPLLCGAPRRGTWLVAGSNFGGPKMPLWVGNLRAVRAGRGPGRQGRSTRGDVARAHRGRAGRAWQVMLGTWPNYAKYEQRTDRRIPVFHLQPRPRG